mmetsp:Transcript_12471/g.14536  ORF Transcript_12471/g.14536 Transcript_12471/m.14536 type:complete len:268 (+) Transcript_12471:14-817(+)
MRIYSLITRSFSLAANSSRTLRVYNVSGITAYEKALNFQRDKRDFLKYPKEDTLGLDNLILVEHNPVYTLGKNSEVKNCLFDLSEENESYQVHKVERGGEVTYHGPGQIVGYTVIDLKRHKKDLHWFLRQIEEVVIQVLGTYGIKGSRHDEYTGVWVGDEKVAAIGLSASKWITMHGFALNVSPEMSDFDRIIPCGIDDPTKSVTSIKELLSSSPDTPQPQLSQVRENIIQTFARQFEYQKVYYHTELSEKGSSFGFNIGKKQAKPA